MKTKIQYNPARSLVLARIVFAASALLPSVACAIDWSGTTGPFTDPANWTGGVVPSATEATIANGGTSNITTGSTIDLTFFYVGGHAGTGFVSQDGGDVTASRVILGGDDSGGSTGQGTYSISGGTLANTGGEVWIGTKGGTGNLNLSGGSTVTGNNWIVVGRDGGTGNVIIGGTAELKNTSQNIGIGVFSPGRSSTVTVKESGKLTSAGELYVGWLANDTNEGNLLVEDSGVVTVAAGLVVGRDNAKGTMTVSDSSTINVGGYFVVAADGSAVGDVTINDSAAVNVTHMVWVGQADTSQGTLTINGGTTVSHSGPLDTTNSSVAFRGASGTLNLNGGILETSGFNKTSGTAAVNFNGGLIRATGVPNTGSFFNNFGDGDLSAQAGGMKIDSNGQDITISQFIVGTGGVIKSGAGTLVLAQPGYGGDTQVDGGVLELQSSFLAETSTVRIAGTGATLRLQNSIYTVDRLFIGGVQKDAGTYGPVGNELGDIGLSQLAGSGSLNVLSGPGDGPTYQQWINGNAPATGFAPDSDKDGVPNGVEHVLGSNPNIWSAGLVGISATASSATFKHTLNPSLANDVMRSYQWSTDLIEWKASGGTNAGGTTATITPSAPVAGEVTVTISVTGGAAGKLFGRLVATQAP